jgi:hypothetical protein
MAHDEKLPDRYDVERAVEASDLPTCSRDILFALARRMDQGTIYIPGQFSPSLYRMAEVSGWSKRHIQRHLNGLEKRQLISRRRKKGVRTQYAINYPALLGTRRPKKPSETGDGESPPVETTGPDTRDAARQELGTSGQRTRDTTARDQISQFSPAPDPDPEITMIRRLVEARTGKQISAEWAAATRDTILAAADAPTMPGPPRSGYIRKIIIREKQPARWLPTPTPPQYHQGEES